MNGTVILRCTCQHDFQDKTYGKGMRVHNVTPKSKANCTVCSNAKTVDHELSAAQLPKKGKKAPK